MEWKLAVLMAAAMVALQLSTIAMRRSWKDELPYVGLLLTDLALLLFAEVTDRPASMAGVVGTMLAAVLVFGPRLVERFEQRAFARDDLEAALRAAKLRELLAPGLGATRRRRQVANLVEAHAGGAAQVLARLDAELAGARAPSEVVTVLLERATVLFLAGRFQECIDVAEKLPGDWPNDHPVLGAYLVRAHAELGEIDKGAAVLRAIEEGAAGRDPGGASLLVQARLTLLAFAGRQLDVDRLIAGDAGTLLSERARAFLHDTARDHKERALPPELTPVLDDVARRAAEGSRPLFRPRRRAPVTVALIVLNLAAAAITVGYFESEELGGLLIRWGALFRPAVESGEWWRAFSAMFLHGGFAHLGLNMYALFMLGRFCEEVLGSLRYFVTYVAGGLAGAVGSTLNTQQAGLSVGASGAIMGLLGALIVVLILRRGTWPERWRRTLLWNLVLLGALQIYVGFQLPMIDNAAHVGGMLGGGATALLVAPGGLLGRSKPARVIVIAFVAGLVALFVFAAVQVARTPLERTFDRLPTRLLNADGQVWRVPSYWEFQPKENVISDPYLGFVLPRGHDAPVPNDPELKRLYDHLERRAKPANAGEECSRPGGECSEPTWRAEPK